MMIRKYTQNYANQEIYQFDRAAVAPQLELIQFVHDNKSMYMYSL